MVGRDRLNGDSGDIILRNADCAEEFTVAAAEGVEPGVVMALNDDAKLRPSQSAYETGVVGVISGAGAYKPGIILDRQGDDSEDRRAVALMGKVYCKASASNGPIKVGDLLTPSEVEGHAMKATDPTRAFGAVIGKALGNLEEGEDLIPILIALQ